MGEGLDEQLYSRQLFVLGRAAQERLQRCRVLVCGELSGLGVEVAKNVLLAGVAELTLSDDAPLRAADLSSCLAATEAGVRAGDARSAAAATHLRDLNAHVKLDTCAAASLSLDDDGYGRFDVVVIVRAARELLEAVGAFCHARGIALVAAGSYGLYGYCFCDFGEEFTVVDADGEQPKQGIVVAVADRETPQDEGEGREGEGEGNEGEGGKGEGEKGEGRARQFVLSTADDKHHGLETGDLVTLRGLRGLGALEDGEPRRVEALQVRNADGQLVDGLAFAVAAPAGARCADYERGGDFLQVKAPVTVRFRALAETLAAPPVVTNDWTDLQGPLKLHAFLLALLDFEREKGRLPAPADAGDAADVVARARAQARALAEPLELAGVDEAKLGRLAKAAAGRLAPMAAYMGGIVAQEVLKACSGKFTPMQQWLHFDSALSVPGGAAAPGADDVPTLAQLGASCGCGCGELGASCSCGELGASCGERSLWRYAGQAAVIGWKAQARLARLRCFMVGSGALGCETLKNMALMGVAAASPRAEGGEGAVGGEADRGVFIVTDMDGIEVSNLNRQFLFRSEHVGKMKSVVAVERVRRLNAGFNAVALQHKVAPDTEDVFDDGFWQGLDVVVNALDNVTARLYVDSKCLFHGKPLLESGTLGTKANTLPVVPGLTESYGSDPVKDASGAGDDIPACTLHAYPNLIEHTLAWARDTVFERYFNLDPLEAAAFLDACSGASAAGATVGTAQAAAGTAGYMRELERQPSTALVRLRAARGVLCGVEPEDHPEKLFPYAVAVDAAGGGADFALCVRLARLRFEELFVNKIEQLLHVHPLDKTVQAPSAGGSEVASAEPVSASASASASASPFWSGKRRPPRREAFDADDELHVLFVSAAAHLYARVYGVDAGWEWEDKEARAGEVRRLVAAMAPPPPYEADDSVAVPENEEQAKALKAKQDADAEKEAASTQERCAVELAKLAPVAEAAALAGPKGAESGEGRAGLRVFPQAFEKDDDGNSHMDVIFAAASIRARSYSIPAVDALEARRIVGRIIPAIATTTAMATGAVALELYKLLHDDLAVEALRASNINLATNSYAAFEPTPCRWALFGRPRFKRRLLRHEQQQQQQALVEGDVRGDGGKEEEAEAEVEEEDELLELSRRKTMRVSIWTMLTLRGNLTVQAIMDYFLEAFDLEVMTVSTKGDVNLYNDMFGQEDRLETPIADLYREVAGAEPPRFIVLNCDGDFVEDDDDDDDDEDDEDEDEFVVPPCRIDWQAE